MEIELRIRDILASPSRLKDKVHTILEELKSCPDQSEDHKILLKFLFNSGHFQELTALIVEMLERQAKIPWDLLIRTFEITNTLPDSNSVLQSISKGVDRQESQQMLWAATGMDEKLPEFVLLRKAYAQNLETVLERKKRDLLEKFEFLSGQRLPSEARRVLRQLRSAYPDDKSIFEVELRFEEEWAREVLSERAINKSLDPHTMTVTRKSIEDLEFLEFWLSEALKLSEKNDSAVSDLAVFFLFLEAPELSLKVLSQQKELTYASHWLKAELLKRSGRHIEALEQASIIESMTDQKTDATFAVAYFKAEVFGELGHFDNALELLESISKIRPGYRSTNYLISMWRTRGSGF